MRVLVLFRNSTCIEMTPKFNFRVPVSWLRWSNTVPLEPSQPHLCCLEDDAFVEGVGSPSPSEAATVPGILGSPTPTLEDTLADTQICFQETAIDPDPYWYADTIPDTPDKKEFANLMPDFIAHDQLAIPETYGVDLDTPAKIECTMAAMQLSEILLFLLVVMLFPKAQIYISTHGRAHLHISL